MKQSGLRFRAGGVAIEWCTELHRRGGSGAPNGKKLWCGPRKSAEILERNKRNDCDEPMDDFRAGWTEAQLLQACGFGSKAYFYL